MSLMPYQMAWTVWRRESPCRTGVATVQDVIDPDMPQDIEKLQKRLGLVLKLPQPSHPAMAS
jgi:hypothetical protein